MFDYPSFPADEIKVLVNLLKGGAFNTADDVRCAWVVTGYALSQMIPVSSLKAVPPCTSEKASEYLSALVSAVHGEPDDLRKTLGGVPWQSIVSVILTLIQSWLSQHGGVTPVPLATVADEMTEDDKSPNTKVSMREFDDEEAPEE